MGRPNGPGFMLSVMPHLLPLAKRHRPKVLAGAGSETRAQLRSKRARPEKLAADAPPPSAPAAPAPN